MRTEEEYLKLESEAKSFKIKLLENKIKRLELKLKEREDVSSVDFSAFRHDPPLVRDSSVYRWGGVGYGDYFSPPTNPPFSTDWQHNEHHG